jgi:hypothetical protein
MAAARQRTAAFSEAGEGAGAVTFERQELFAGPEDALDALADRGEVCSSSGFVAAQWADDRRARSLTSAAKSRPGVALVAEQDVAALALAAGQQVEGDVAFLALGLVSANARGASGAKIACSRKPQMKRLWLAQ